MRLERVGVDAGGDGVGGVVEAVDELEAEGNHQRDAQQHEGQDRRRVDSGEVRSKVRADVDQATDQHDAEDDGAPFSGWGVLELLIEERGLRGRNDACCAGHEASVEQEPGVVCEIAMNFWGPRVFVSDGGAVCLLARCVIDDGVTHFRGGHFLRRGLSP